MVLQEAPLGAKLVTPHTLLQNLMLAEVVLPMELLPAGVNPLGVVGVEQQEGFIPTVDRHYHHSTKMLLQEQSYYEQYTTT